LEENRPISFGNIEFKNADDADYVAFAVDYRIHPGYTFRDGDNFDFMVMRLDREIPVAPAILNSESSIPSPGETLTTMGFGFTHEDGNSQSNVLLEVQVNYIEDCLNEKLYPDYVDYEYLRPGPEQEHLCAGVENGGKDSCVGDR
jgi:Trypsin